MVLVARERLAGRAEVIVADAQSLPYPDESRDLIVRSLLSPLSPGPVMCAK